MNTPASALDESWEYGSDMHLPAPETLRELAGPETVKHYYPRSIFHGCGSSVIQQILEWGRVERGWSRVWIPSYYCASQIPAFENCGMSAAFCETRLPVLQYRDTPFLETPGLPQALEPGDVVIRCNYFGWRGAEATISADELGCEVIEDHCHDPFGAWAIGSRATFCFTTLRKMFPVPDGALLWSPGGEPLPPEPETVPGHLATAHARLSAMVLKSAYLGAAGVGKELFRALQHRVEDEIGGNGVTGISPLSRELLGVLSARKVSERLRENFETFAANAPKNVTRHLARTAIAQGCHPFAIVFDLGNKALRDEVRTRLVESRIYPAIFWELGGDVADPLSHQHADRILALPCDFRYCASDLERMRAVLDEAISFRSRGGAQFPAREQAGFLACS